MTWQGVTRSLKSAVPTSARLRYHKARQRYSYLQWLASRGPHQHPYLKRFSPSFPARLILGLPPGAVLSVPPTPTVKTLAIRHYAIRYSLTTFVETGTYLGETVNNVADLFDRCITIELSDELYARATMRFATMRHVQCCHGDSGALLSSIVPTINGPALFWLDAHTSGPGTASAGYDPIAHELDAIFTHSDRRHVILIDDADCHVENVVSSIIPSNYAVSTKNNIIRMVPVTS
jgi:hypothetical protein